MQIDPRFIGSFSEEESAKMRKIFLIASDIWPTSQTLNTGLKYKLASAIIYICTSEKQGGCFHRSDNLEIAQEAIDVLLELPRRAAAPAFSGFVTS